MEAERDRRPVLVVVGGLPAAGKTTIAAALARQVGAVFLRVDSIERYVAREIYNILCPAPITAASNREDAVQAA